MNRIQTEIEQEYDPSSLLDVSTDDERFIFEKASQYQYINYFRIFDTKENCYGIPHVGLEKHKGNWCPLMTTTRENSHYVLSHLHNRFLTVHEAIEDVCGTLARGLVFNINYNVLRTWAESRYEIHEIEFIKNKRNPIQFVSNILEFDINYTEETINRLFYKHT